MNKAILWNLYWLKYVSYLVANISSSPSPFIILINSHSHVDWTENIRRFESAVPEEDLVR